MADRSTLLPLFALASVVGALAASSGCPARECASQSQCPSGQYCASTYTCEEIPVVGDGDGDGDVIIGDGDGDGDGDGGVLVDGGDGDGDGELPQRQVNLDRAPAPWIMRDPRPGREDIILVPQYRQNSFAGLYEMDAIDPPSGISDEDIDLFSMNGGPCDVDMISFEGELTVGDKEETWIVCGNSTGTGELRIVFDDDYNGEITNELPSVQFGIPVTSAFNGENDYERRAWAKRGGGLTVFQLRDAGEDQVGQPRNTDTLSVDLSAVVQLWQVFEEGNNPSADHLLVFERSDPPRLVPLMRFRDEFVWRGNTLGLEVGELPSGTVAVVVFPNRINVQGDNEAGDFNVVALVPSEGRAYFYQYFGNTMLEQGETRYETQANYSSSLADPDASERLLLEVRGNYVWFAHPNSSRAWRIPIDDFSEEDRVVRYTSDVATDLIHGIVPISDTQAWLNVPTQSQLQLRTFDANN